MKLSIQKWGNSAALRLPVGMLSALGAKVGDAFEVDLSAGQVLLRVAKPRYKLADLLAEMPEQLPRVEGWDAMTAVGLEVM
ncbi:hypothetical protein M5C96_14765 [Acidovorax sp. GBBC 1281]|nr:AbrB/MazE/SpoVT family DNA-binding domain-containing protein [Acidovorax sp. GBBC 1281]WCM95741.1 hypothetical protein M5C96_14765 [Acidovorax sp. GBBC 1281]